jgi:chaperonin GroES
MSVPIQPMEDYVVAVADVAETKTASGIFLPGNAQEKPKTVKVVAVGKEVDGVKIGDSIIYKNTYEATEVKVGKEEYVLIYKKNIIATVK